MREDLLIVDELAGDADRIGRGNEEPEAEPGSAEQRSRPRREE
jgi:hypothetical protein